MGHYFWFSGPYNGPNGPILKFFSKISDFWPIFIGSKNHLLIIKNPSFLGYLHHFPQFFEWGGRFFGYLDFCYNKVDFTFCDPQGGLTFTRPQILDVSLACRLRFDPKWSQNKMQLVRGCFGDFLLLAHFRRSGLYL